MSGLDNFLKDSKELIGVESTDVKQGFKKAKWINIRKFAGALGDENPLWFDPAYGATTRYNTLIAPPTFVVGNRVPASSGPLEKKDYGCLVNLLECAGFTWFDVIKMGDELCSTLKLIGVSERKSQEGKRIASLKSGARYFNGYGNPIAIGRGVMNVIPLARGEEWVLEREIYRYSDEEIKKIENDLDTVISRRRRGNQPRYWSDVRVGDELPFLVKGPVSLADQMAWLVAEGRELKLGSLVYHELIKERPGAIRVNPITSWPYWDHDQEFEDIISCRDMGFKNANPGRLITRVCLAGQLLSDWMGDHGFLRNLEVDLSNQWVYGDTMWLNGTVLQKFEEEIEKKKYYATEIKVEGINQLNEKVLTGSATVYLPEPGRHVSIPIPSEGCFS